MSGHLTTHVRVIMWTDTSMHHTKPCRTETKTRTGFMFGLNLPDQPSSVRIRDLPLSSWLPSVNDCASLRRVFIILVSRVLTSHLDFLAPFSSAFAEQILTIDVNKKKKNSGDSSLFLLFIPLVIFRFLLE